MTHAALNRLTFPGIATHGRPARAAQAARRCRRPSSTSATSPGRETAVLAGGCFLGMQSVYRHVKGVIDVSAGYSGGTAETATYRMVSSGRTEHAEAVEITFRAGELRLAAADLFLGGP